MSDDLIMFIITAVLWLGFYMGVIKNNKGSIMKLDGKLEKVVEGQALMNSKVDILQHDMNAVREKENTQVGLFKEFDKSIHDLDKRVNILEQKAS